MRIPDRPAYSESLYRLRCHGPPPEYDNFTNFSLTIMVVFILLFLCLAFCYLFSKRFCLLLVFLYFPYVPLLSFSVISLVSVVSASNNNNNNNRIIIFIVTK